MAGLYDLTDDELAAVIAALREKFDNDRYPNVAAPGAAEISAGEARSGVGS